MFKRFILAAAAALTLASPAFASVYGPWWWVDRTAQPSTSTDAFGNVVTTYPALSGAYAITDQATYQAHLVALAPYAATGPLPAQSVLAGDDPASPRATVILHFPDFATAQAVFDQVNGPVTPPPSSLPDEVAMFRVRLVMGMTASAHGGTLEDRVSAFIASLPADQQYVANRLWNGPNPAPNLVVGGSFAQGFKAWEGLTDAQWGALLAQAVGLAL
jgi:hypothetical protein